MVLAVWFIIHTEVVYKLLWSGTHHIAAAVLYILRSSLNVEAPHRKSSGTVCLSIFRQVAPADWQIVHNPTTTISKADENLYSPTNSK